MAVLKSWHALALVGGICVAVSFFVGDKDADGVANSMLRKGTVAQDQETDAAGNALVTQKYEGNTADYDDWHDVEIADYAQPPTVAATPSVVAQPSRSSAPPPVNQNGERPRSNMPRPGSRSDQALARDVSRALANKSKQ